MDQAWGMQSTSKNSGGDTPVSILLAGPPDRTVAWYQAVQLDARFRVSSMANDPQDLQAKLAASPEVILLDGTIFAGPAPLVQSLTAISGAVYLVVPGNVGDQDIEKIKSVPSVKAVYRGDANIQDLMTRAYADALALRRTAPAISPTAWAAGRGNATIAGLRIITVWSRSGGSGRTSVAASLAQAIARRGLKTLLIGLGAPDVLPLHLGLQPEPNIMTWFSNPTDEGLRGSLQTVGDLHVMAGFPDVLSEGQGDRPADVKGSIAELATSAAYGGYAAVIMDTPVAGVAPRAVSAANTWLLVSRPTVSDVWASVEAFRTVTQKAAGQHRITPGNVFTVLNMRANGMLTADEWHRAADAGSRKLGLNAGFPPVTTTIPYSPDVPLAQDNGRSALDAADDFARPIHKLAEMLFGQTVGSATSSDDLGTVKLGPLKIRTKR
jgi:cellulose biosynthesis protein BcsQ